MIQQVVASIIEAEDKAKQMIADTETQATEIAQQAIKSVKIIENQASAKRKQYIVSSNTSASSKAHTQSQKMMADGKAEVDQQLEQHNVNSGKAVAYVMEQIL